MKEVTINYDELEVIDFIPYIIKREGLPDVPHPTMTGQAVVKIPMLLDGEVVYPTLLLDVVIHKERQFCWLRMPYLFRDPKNIKSRENAFHLPGQDVTNTFQVKCLLQLKNKFPDSMKIPDLAKAKKEFRKASLAMKKAAGFHKKKKFKPKGEYKPGEKREFKPRDPNSSYHKKPYEKREYVPGKARSDSTFRTGTFSTKSMDKKY